MTTVAVDYECGCRYELPTAIPDTGLILHHRTTYKTVKMLADAMHAAECPAAQEQEPNTCAT